MTIDLLPGLGVRLPAPLPELHFGLTEAAVLALLAPHGELLPDGVHSTFVCGCRWSLGFRLPGVGVSLSAHHEDALADVWVGLNPHDDRPACPVGYLGIDVFGWPARELAEALRAEGLPVPDPVHGTLRHQELHLHASTGRPPRPGPGRKTRHEVPYHFDSVSLHRTTPEATR